MPQMNPVEGPETWMIDDTKYDEHDPFRGRDLQARCRGTSRRCRARRSSGWLT